MAFSLLKLKKVFQLASITDPKATIAGNKAPITKVKPSNGVVPTASEKKIITKESIAEMKVNGDVNSCPQQAETNREAHSE